MKKENKKILIDLIVSAGLTVVGILAVALMKDIFVALLFWIMAFGAIRYGIA